MVLESRARPPTRDTHRKLRHVHILPGWLVVAGRVLRVLLPSGVLFYTCLLPLICLSTLRCLDARLKLDRIRNAAAAAASFLEASGETGAFER